MLVRRRRAHQLPASAYLSLLRVINLRLVLVRFKDLSRNTMSSQTNNNSSSHLTQLKNERQRDAFCGKNHEQSPLDLIAPFERDEVIVGRRVGSGSFSFVYEIKAFSLRPDQSDVYTEEQIEKREATVRSMSYGAKYVLKCLKDELEHSEDEGLFTDAAEDIAHEAEMLAALSHPNIVKLHGVIANRHEAFLDGASSFFVILERLESTLSDKIEVWKEKNSTNLSSSIRSLGSSFHSISSASGALVSEADTNDAGSLENRLGIASSLAGAVAYLHSQDVIFHDLKPDNVGFDTFGNVKLFDFGLARFMPRFGDSYNDLYEMSGAGTPRFSAPEVCFEMPYNLKADVYSFGVVLWGVMSLKKPFGKCKSKKELTRSLSQGEALAISRKWPLSIQDIIRRSLSGDHTQRPTMSDVCKVMETSIKELKDSTFDYSPPLKNKDRKHSFLSSKLSSSKRFFRNTPVTDSDTADSFQELLNQLEL